MFRNLLFVLLILPASSLAQNFESLISVKPIGAHTSSLPDSSGTMKSFLNKVKNKRDSLEQVSIPDSSLICSLEQVKLQTDSLRMSLDSLPSLHLPEDMARVQLSVGRLQGRINKRLAGLGQAGVEGLPGSINVPNVSSPVDINDINSLSIDIPSSDIPTSSIPDLNLSDLKIPDVQAQDISIPNVSGQDIALPEVNSSSLPDVSMSSVPDIGGIEKIDKYVNRVGDASEQLKDHQGKINDLKVDSDRFEEEILKLDETEALTKRIEEADQMKRYYDPDVAKEEALKKVKQEAINHFAGREDQLKASMQKLSELKAKYADTEGALDLFAKKQRPLKGKPLFERFIPGLTFQFQKSESFWLDINPHIGFIVSRKFVSGFGWNTRIAYDFSLEEYDHLSRINGPRFFFHFKFKEGIHLKADVECMNVSMRKLLDKSEEIIRGWTWSYFVGVKKDFRLSKRLKGNAQMLYNFYDPKQRSPYTNRLNVRLGIEVPLKRKNKLMNSFSAK